jgi:hypothetical protein
LASTLSDGHALGDLEAAWPKGHRCPVFGWPLFLGKRNGHVNPASPSLDRIDHTRGYEPGNVRIISFRANTLASDASPEELAQVARWLARASRNIRRRKARASKAPL